ncbi:hypothetical protein J2Z37_004331 [Ammoniphilus resinae]|uniref:Uncharacterized protein n=1 Tax=Ammoniphilus resinae TaxID=861532 RepID=A0ABS4GVM3_9BACL|nr:hypothetical protein [Ammoniphilus resinae]
MSLFQGLFNDEDFVIILVLYVLLVIVLAAAD